MLLDKFWPSNGIEISIDYRSDNFISEYVHGFECKSNNDKIWSVVDMVIILNFLEFEKSCSRKFKVITISTTDHISSRFDLYLNLGTNSKTILSDLLYTEFSVLLSDYNVFKKHGVMMYETKYLYRMNIYRIWTKHDNWYFLDWFWPSNGFENWIHNRLEWIDW